MITLKNLKLHNFLSHESTDVSFDGGRKLLIDGNSGSGKTSLLEAIIWGLYGVGRSNNPDLVRTGQDKAEVVLTVDQDGSEVEITRSIAKKGKHTLTIAIDGVAHPKTGVRELQTWIEEELTGASYLLFVNSIAYLQGGADSFVTQNAGKRKELLLEIIKTIDFEAYYELTKKKIAEQETQSLIADGDRANATQALETAQSVVAKKAETEEKLAMWKVQAENLEAQKEKLKSNLSGKAEREQKITEKKTERDAHAQNVTKIELMIDELQEQINRLEVKATKEVEDIDTLQKNLDTAEANLESTKLAIGEVSKLNQEKSDLYQQQPKNPNTGPHIASLDEQISKMSAANLCSQGENCPNFSATLLRIEEARTQREKLEAQQKEYEAAYSEWETKYNALTSTPLDDLQATEKQYSTEVKELTAKIHEARDVEQSKETVQLLRMQSLTRFSELQNAAENKTEAEKVITELEAQGDPAQEGQWEAELRDIETSIATNKTSQSSLERELGVIDNYEKQIPVEQERQAKAQEKLDEININLRRLELLKDAFGNKGIKALVIDYVIPELEENINMILSKMSDFRVLLDTQQEKQSGDGSKEGLFITIVNDMGEEMPFESYSGGQKLQITVAITEALAKLQKCGFRLFDEVFLGLDDTSLESFTQVIDSLLEQFPQVICVSHLTEIKASFEDKIRIIRHNGVSYVETS